MFTSTNNRNLRRSPGLRLTNTIVRCGCIQFDNWKPDPSPKTKGHNYEHPDFLVLQLLVLFLDQFFSNGVKGKKKKNGVGMKLSYYMLLS